MRDYYFDPITKDIALTEKKDIRFTETIEEYTAQKIENLFNFFIGEWYLNEDEGMPYMQQNNFDRDDPNMNILSKRPNLSWIKNRFMLQLKKVKTIKKIVKIDLTLDTMNRELQVYYETILIDGTSFNKNLPLSLGV